MKLIRLAPFILLFHLCLTGKVYSQKERSITVSYNKDYLWSFKTNQGGYLKHNWGLTKRWYLSGGLGFWAWERNKILINHRTDIMITIFPEYDFALKDVIQATDGRVGFAQRHTHWSMELHVPAFLTCGRSWLRKSRRFALETDVGLLVAYTQNELYGWTDFIAIQSGLNIPDPKFVNQNDDPAYWLQGKSIKASIEPGVSINIEGSYYLTDNFGLGLNIFMGAYLFYGGYSTYGLHFKYRY
jgi:hypothetical protein